MLSAVPEQGQLVEVRRRQYVVTDVAASAPPSEALHFSAPNDSRPQHLVALASIEDDALGEELRVRWELEPGARIREQSTLPEPVGFDAPERLDAFLDAVRWGRCRRPTGARCWRRFAAASKGRLPARSVGAGRADAPGEPAYCRRCRAGQDH